MRSFVHPEANMKARIIAKQRCNFVIGGDIVKKLFSTLLFDNSSGDEEDNADVERAKQRALKSFVHNEEEDVYVVEVKSILKLNLLNKFVSVGVSFRQASRLYQSVKEEIGMGILGNDSEGCATLQNRGCNQSAVLKRDLQECLGFFYCHRCW